MLTVKDILLQNPLMKYWQIMNYRRFNSEIGIIIDGKLYYTEEEKEILEKEIYKDNEKKRKFIYNYIKEHPFIKEKDLWKHLCRYTKTYKFTKDNVKSTLADISEQVVYKDYPNLYQDDENQLFVEGYEVNLKKKYDKNHGLFCDILRRRTSVKS